MSKMLQKKDVFNCMCKRYGSFNCVFDKRLQEKVWNEKRNCRFSGGVFVGIVNFLFCQVFSDEFYSFIYNEFYVWF